MGQFVQFHLRLVCLSAGCLVLRDTGNELVSGGHGVVVAAVGVGLNVCPAQC